jgi:hypothetical protein
VLFNLVPCQDSIVNVVQRGRGRQSDKNAAVLAGSYGEGHFEVLADTPDDRPER